MTDALSSLAESERDAGKWRDNTEDVTPEAAAARLVVILVALSVVGSRNVDAILAAYADDARIYEPVSYSPF